MTTRQEQAAQPDDGRPSAERPPGRPWYRKPEWQIGTALAVAGILVPLVFEVVTGDDPPPTPPSITVVPPAPSSGPDSAVTTTAVPENDPRWNRVYSRVQVEISSSRKTEQGGCLYTVVGWDRPSPMVFIDQNQSGDLKFFRECREYNDPKILGPLREAPIMEPTPQLCYEIAEGPEHPDGNASIEDRFWAGAVGSSFCVITRGNNVLWFSVLERSENPAQPMFRIEATLWTRRA